MDFESFAEARDFGDNVLRETAQHSRYSVEVTYRTELAEVTDAFAKLCLGYVGAALKNCGYHVKTVFAARPYRVLVGSRNWDDGELVAIAAYHHADNCFVIGEGTYNRDKKTVRVRRSRRSDHKSAADVVKDLRNLMEKLKRETPPPPPLAPAKLKRGPKPMALAKIKKLARGG